MKNYVLFAGLGISLALIASCKKDNPEPEVEDNNTPPETQSVKDYFPMTAGSYWVYQQTMYDTSGNVKPQTWKNDSVVVLNDTVIGSNTYHFVAEYNFVGQATPFFHYYRDSADCVTDDQGNIIFSVNPELIYKDILTSDTVAYVNYSYNSSPTSVTVPLGTYSCVDFKGDMYRKMDNFSKAYPLHKYSYKNIGLVKKTAMYVGSLDQIHFDLKAYHIQ